ncbi:MAG: hypothetical protein IRZ16_12555 [Myxococcaceae bacterium]|nr:hypothetical protein [Myxococcaceae bacterium]
MACALIERVPRQLGVLRGAVEKLAESPPLPEPLPVETGRVRPPLRTPRAPGP